MLFQPWLRHGRNTGESAGAQSAQRLPCAKGAGSRVSRKRETEGLSKTASDLIRPFGPPSPPRGRQGGGLPHQCEHWFAMTCGVKGKQKCRRLSRRGRCPHRPEAEYRRASGTMWASSPTDSFVALGRTGGLPHQSADWFAMTCVVRSRFAMTCVVQSRFAMTAPTEAHRRNDIERYPMVHRTRTRWRTHCPRRRAD